MSLSAEASARLADAVLLFHLAVILFNIFGLVATPLGGWLGWSFVRIAWWRALHLLSLAVVALQALMQRACFLTLWQNDLVTGGGGAVSHDPFIQHWVNRLVYWPLPFWVFEVLYVAVWVYALALWWFVPPRRRRRTVLDAATKRP